MGLAGSSFTAPSSCSVSGRRARSNATSKGATAIQDSTYEFGRGKIMTCNTAEAMASRHALLSIPRMNEKEYQGTGIEVGIALSRSRKMVQQLSGVLQKRSA